ncbi:uncharacterized protein At1g76070-like [Gastrolobium bilobum]|uniref:uncharacterized protein At1g76070-like n=1 Tax=Gastrolobium bilobum TaxID=150636 RepID=UPI002AB1AC29|nr:uncharacterized protein At1g76070-like [Gastrolobium bilobum]
MERHLKLKNKILKILPKTVSAITVTFQNPPFSPGRDHKSRPENTTRWLKPHGGKGFSGPIISMIPDEARRKSNDGGNGIENQEPTSPKISCMGQIKHKKKQIKKAKANNKSLPKEARKVVSNASSSTSRDIVAKKRVSTFQRMLFHVAKPRSAGRKSDASATQPNKDEFADKAPRVSQMKRFASGRDALANFDWKVQVVQEGIDYYSDEDRVDSDDAEEEDVIIPFSAPILVGGGVGHGGELNLKPRKEINLWKRRTMAPPRPLQLDAVI